MLTEEEVAAYLNIPQSEVAHLIKRGRLTAYRVGGAYLRFHKEEVVALKSGRRFVPPDEISRSWIDRALDFWKFHSFYIIATVFVLLLIGLFFQYQ